MGTRAAAAKGDWQKGVLRATKTKEGWTLWASVAAATGRPQRAELKLRLHKLRLTEAWTPLTRSAARLLMGQWEQSIDTLDS